MQVYHITFRALQERLIRKMASYVAKRHVIVETGSSVSLQTPPNCSSSNISSNSPGQNTRLSKDRYCGITTAGVSHKHGRVMSLLSLDSLVQVEAGSSSPSNVIIEIEVKNLQILKAFFY